MRLYTPLLMLALLGVAACDDGESPTRSGTETEVAVPLGELPAVVKAAVEEALPGLKLTEAERETEDGQTTYEVEGTLNGKRYELEVTSAGKVIDLESDDEDDEDEDS